MKGTLLFVHGTGVRQDGYDRTLRLMEETAHRTYLRGVEVVGCPWGASFGVPIDRFAPTLPADVTTRDLATAPPTEAELAITTWALLIEDPLFELRLLAGQGVAAAPAFAINAARADQAALTMVGSLQGKAAALDLVPAGIASKEIADAAAATATSTELAGAATARGNAADPDLIEAAARAVVAHVLASHHLDPPGSAPPVALDGALRDALVRQVADAMAPAATRGGLSDWVKRRVVDFAAQRATSALRARRSSVTGLSLPALGDILFYQRRGEGIRQMVASALRGLRSPVVAVGHSLGGIVLVDLLTAGGAPAVDLLVTAGSQAPLLYAIDALESVRWGNAQPAPPAPWLNIYNRQDFLSYCAARIFPGVAGIRDEEVDPGVPFPESHSAYWAHERTYALIRDAWPAT